ncbi:hypothetical protein BCR33DRAFT_856177 [Rhizoclosmatium globosum]|uniref:F-box domain-containing protein n=1 Tax=Rhizoclosmatium globosum TaxID=329046 RepID=A0A1Y2BGI9_9FUNG|nr:hypothetical protein BCR33DRAFT_856177 [Rhizoclosmatium globosum]|eukprot:ORY33914.1 hypothetical protein BCR33DRAFT_856177 [Rhizoclosmatium globosum]
MSQFALLPNEIRANVFVYLDPHDLFRLRRVSKAVGQELIELTLLFSFAQLNIQIFCADYTSTTTGILNSYCFDNLNWHNLPTIYLEAAILEFGFDSVSPMVNDRYKMEEALWNIINQPVGRIGTRKLRDSEVIEALDFVSKGKDAHLLVKLLAGGQEPSSRLFVNAIKYGNSSMIQALFQAIKTPSECCDVCTFGCYRQVRNQLLALAAKSGNASVFRFLLGCNAVDVSYNNNAALLAAIRYGNYQIAFDILEDSRFNFTAPNNIAREQAILEARAKYKDVYQLLNYFGSSRN